MKSKSVAYINSKKDSIYPIGLALVLALGILLGVNLKQEPGRTSLTVFPRNDKLTSVLRYIEDQYVDSVSMSELVELTIPSLLKNLDPHSVYIPASELREANEVLDGGFEGIGISFNMPNDTVIVINTIHGGPSERLGLLAGDRIVTIDGTNVAGVKIDQGDIVRMLKGHRGTEVVVGIQRRGVDEVIIFNITRDKIPLYSVDISYMVTPKIGYIKISKFARTTYSEFIEAIDALNAKGMQRLILDLRGNSGGYLDAATSIANEFLPEGKLIVYTQGKARARQNILSNSRGKCINTPVVVLIDEFSASASEILAGAIQDNDRGIVVGRRSFGKGLVQEQILFTDGSALRLTIARYYTPTGRSIQKPYEPGSEEYHLDLSNRYMHGEFQEQDSITFPDSLRFVTPGGRIVYGGGGIMPDIFTPMDTSGITPYFISVDSRNLIYRFAFDFTDNNRNTLSRFKRAEEIQAYLSKKNLLNQFVDYAKRNGIEPNPNQIRASKQIIEYQLMAYIARNMLDNEGYFPIIRKLDTTLKRAISVLEGDEVSQLLQGGSPSGNTTRN